MPNFWEVAPTNWALREKVQARRKPWEEPPPEPQAPETPWWEPSWAKAPFQFAKGIQEQVPWNLRQLWAQAQQGVTPVTEQEVNVPEEELRRRGAAAETTRSQVFQKRALPLQEFPWIPSLQAAVPPREGITYPSPLPPAGNVSEQVGRVAAGVAVPPSLLDVLASGPWLAIPSGKAIPKVAEAVGPAAKRLATEEAGFAKIPGKAPRSLEKVHSEFRAAVGEYESLPLRQRGLDKGVALQKKINKLSNELEALKAKTAAPEVQPVAPMPPIEAAPQATMGAGVLAQAKEPWQMTRDQYLAQNEVTVDIRKVLGQTKHWIAEIKNSKGQTIGGKELFDRSAAETFKMAREANANLYHEGQVEQAVSEGKLVPPEVLKDYPDLVAKAQPPVAQVPKTISPAEAAVQPPSAAPEATITARPAEVFPPTEARPSAGIPVAEAPAPPSGWEPLPPVGEMAAMPLPEDVVAKLTRLVKETKTVVGTPEMHLLRHQQKAKQAAQMEQIFQKYSGEEAQRRALATLKGTLPKTEFAPMPKEQLTTGDVTQLLDKIWQSERLQSFQKIGASEGFGRLVLGEIPARHQLILLEKVYGKDLVKELLARRKLGVRAGDLFLDIIGIPKASAASFDISAPGRQGLALLYRPEWWKSWKPMMQALVKEDNAQAVLQSIEKHPLYGMSQDAGLYLAPYGEFAPHLARSEEVFMSHLADKLPWIKWSNRAYVTYLNKLRSDTFYNQIATWQKQGLSPAEVLHKAGQFADFINVATGRGNIGRLNETGAVVLNATFFSPRFVASRFQLPLKVFKSDPEVRKEVFKALGAWFGAGASILFLATQSGAKVELDPRSTDFAKVRIGNTRIDPWAGMQPLARATAQFLTATRKTSESWITQTGRLEVAGRFVESKLSPSASLIIDGLRGANFIGEPMEATTETITRESTARLMPMTIQDMIDGFRESGLLGLAITPLSASGLSVQTYPVQDPKDVVARRDYNKDFQDLPHKDQAQVLANPDVVRASSGTPRGKLFAQQLEDDANLINHTGGMTAKVWQDRLYNRMSLIAWENNRRGKAIPPEGSTQEKKALNGYYAIYDGLGDNPTPDELREAGQKADTYLAGLPQDTQDYIENQRWRWATPTALEFKEAKTKLKPYYDIAEKYRSRPTSFGISVYDALVKIQQFRAAKDDFQAQIYGRDPAVKQANVRIVQEREWLRHHNPEIEALCVKWLGLKSIWGR